MGQDHGENPGLTGEQVYADIASLDSTSACRPNVRLQLEVLVSSEIVAALRPSLRDLVLFLLNTTYMRSLHDGR